MIRFGPIKVIKFIQLIIQMASNLLGLIKEGEQAHPGFTRQFTDIINFGGENQSKLKNSQQQIIEHFANLIRGSVENKSQLKGLSNIEIFSYFVRKNKFQFEELMKDTALSSKVNSSKVYPGYVTAVERLNNNLTKIEDNRAYLRPDVMQEYHALKTAGISIGETNAFHLNKVVKTLAIEHQTKSIRFWGKILGYKDYYVIQGSSTKTYLNQLSDDGEKYGNGVNTYSYWVATDILGSWSELPLVTPQQVAGSRTFKYVFTGHLQKPVLNSASFKGEEKHLLKCIISRITHSCELAPKGLYKMNEENPTILEFEEEFKTPQIAEMNSLDSWIHLNPHILNQGRCTYYIDPKLNQEQKQALNTELAQKDPIVERLKGISEDKPYQALGFTTNWSVSISGETIPINQIGKLEGTSLVYGVATLRNLVWPGAATVGYRGGWVNIYIGYGHRLSQQFNLIRELKELQVQAEEKTERPEPNPSKVPEQKKQQVPPPE